MAECICRGQRPAAYRGSLFYRCYDPERLCRRLQGVRKNAPDEKVGVMCLEDGRPSIVEYYELTVN